MLDRKIVTIVSRKITAPRSDQGSVNSYALVPNKLNRLYLTENVS